MKLLNHNTIYSSVTILGLVVVVLLQLFWAVHTYSILERSMKDNANQQLILSLNKEAWKRFNTTKNDTLHIKDENRLYDKNGIEIGIMDAMETQAHTHINMQSLDSIYVQALTSKNIKSKFSLQLTNPLTGEIKQNIRPELHSWAEVSTITAPIRRNGSLAVRATLISPYEDVFEQMGMMLIGTVILFGMVIYCILFQISIIIKQQENTRLHEDFSYAMVHDMKTPLSSIITCERMLHSGRLDDKPQLREKYHIIVENEADHLLSLANKILNLSKLETNKLVLNKYRVELEPIVKDLEEKFTAKSTKPVKFYFDINAKEVYADGEFVKEAISNLIDNATKYSKAEIEISISSYMEGRYTAIKVRDNGIGISEKDQKTIFNKFERASAVRRTLKGGPTGFGLGLNYVYQVTLAHDGMVKVNSKEGEFSEFILYLPTENMNKA